MPRTLWNTNLEPAASPQKPHTAMCEVYEDRDGHKNEGYGGSLGMKTTESSEGRPSEATSRRHKTDLSTPCSLLESRAPVPVAQMDKDSHEGPVPSNKTPFSSASLSGSLLLLILTLSLLAMALTTCWFSPSGHKMSFKNLSFCESGMGGDYLTSPVSIFFLNLILAGRRERERERNTDSLFHPFKHSPVVSLGALTREGSNP